MHSLQACDDPCGRSVTTQQLTASQWLPRCGALPPAAAVTPFPLCTTISELILDPKSLLTHGSRDSSL